MKKIGRFLIISFLLGWALQIGSIISQNNMWLKFTMWVPAIAFLVCDPKQVFDHLKSLSFSKTLYIPLAILTGWIWSILYFAFLVLFGKSQWNSQFQLSTDGNTIEGIHGFGMLLGFGKQSMGFFSLNLLLTLTFGSLLFGIIGGLGEEIGWRGFLQPELEKKFGIIKSTLTVGLIWGLWHIPANLAGLNNATYPLVTTFIAFPVFTIALSAIFGGLQRKFKSVYFPAIAHGANNCLAAGFIIKPQDSEGDLVAGVCASVAIIILSYFIFRIISSKAKKPVE